MSLSLAAGGFAVGIVCAIAAVNVASDFIRPVAMEAEPVQNIDTARPIPVYSAASALPAGKASDVSEGETTRSRARSTVKTALPTIGRAVPVASETDGRGDSSVKMPPVRLTNDAGAPAVKADGDVKLIRSETTLLREDTPTPRDETKIATHSPAPQATGPQTPEAAAPPEQAKPAPVKKRTTYRRTKPRRTHEARRPERQRQIYAAPYRAGPVYGYNGGQVRGGFFYPY